MDRFLRPERFDGDPTISSSAPVWEHWKRTFENFLIAYETASISTVNNVSSASVSTQPAPLSDAVKLQLLACMLATRRQQPGDSIDTYLQAPTQLSKKCQFAAVDAETNEVVSHNFVYIYRV
ncbi:hypothetical protein ACJJTC_012450 [Scirpophaga incertulas]